MMHVMMFVDGENEAIYPSLTYVNESFHFNDNITRAGERSDVTRHITSHQLYHMMQAR